MSEPVRVLICGGRDFDRVGDAHAYLNALAALRPFSVVIEGGARGADSIAKGWAITHGIPVEEYPADWIKHGRAAGPIRNKQMLDEGKPDYVIAFPGGVGTANMVALAKRAGVKVLIYPTATRAGEP